jgi:SulP family sulfate permease
VRFNRTQLWRNLAARVSNRAINPFPVRQVVESYGPTQARSDLIAALNVALLAFPQGMAYAMIAGLPIEYGIFGSAVATIVGPLFSGSRFIVLGPTNATSVLLLSTFLALGIPEGDRGTLLPILLCMTALFQILGAVLNAAKLIQYISRSVVVGYITAAAILIIANQLQNTLGFKIHGVSTFAGVVVRTAESISETQWPTVTLSLLTAAIFIILRRWFAKLPTVAITLVLSSLMAVGFGHFDLEVEKLKAVTAGSFAFTMPNLDFSTLGSLGSAALAIAFLSVLEGSSIGKSLAAMSGARLNTNQELFSMGMANLACGFLNGMPASGSLTRSVLNWTSGAATTLASLFSGMICVGLFLGLGSFIAYIPKASLAVVVVFVALSLINPTQIRLVTKTTSGDAAVFLLTFGAALLFPLDTAIYFGAGLSIILFLYQAGEPELIEYTYDDQGELTELRKHQSRRVPEISIVHVEGSLFFAAAELLQEQLRRVCDDPNLKIIILRLKNAHHLDATSILALEELIGFMRERDRHLIISGARKDVYRICKRTGLLDLIGRTNFLMEWPQNPTLSSRNALKRAQEILGSKDAEISIFGETVMKKVKN